MLDRVARLTLALGDKIDDRGYLAMSTKCVYGVHQAHGLHGLHGAVDAR